MDNGDRETSVGEAVAIGTGLVLALSLVILEIPVTLETAMEIWELTPEYSALGLYGAATAILVDFVAGFFTVAGSLKCVDCVR